LTNGIAFDIDCWILELAVCDWQITGWRCKRRRERLFLKFTISSHGSGSLLRKVAEAAAFFLLTSQKFAV
jgi:hypothetical protein